MDDLKSKVVIKYSLGVWQSCLGVCHRLGDWLFCLVISQINSESWCVALMGIASYQWVMVCSAAHGDWGSMAGLVSKDQLSSTGGRSHYLISNFTSQKIFLICWRCLPFLVPWWVKLNRPTAGQVFSLTDMTTSVILCLCAYFTPVSTLQVALQESGADIEQTYSLDKLPHSSSSCFMCCLGCQGHWKDENSIKEDNFSLLFTDNSEFLEMPQSIFLGWSEFFG